MRLNFEFNIECYSRPLAASLGRLVDEKLAAAKPLELEQVQSRRFPVKLRDGVTRLFAPYL
jgi:cardiolipin synthase